ALNLAQLCKEWSDEVVKEIKFKDLELVPAPKSLPWSFSKDQCTISTYNKLLGDNSEELSPFCIEWQPSDPENVKLRPLAHIPIKEQSIMTLILMCLANKVETLQGDPSTEYSEVHNTGV